MHKYRYYVLLYSLIYYLFNHSVSSFDSQTISLASNDGAIGLEVNIEISYYVEIKCQLDATDDIYCRFYCMLNMFRAILCPSSGAREYYKDDRCLWYLVLWCSGCRYGVELKVMCPVCRLQLANLNTKAPNTTGSDHLYNTLELLMMGIVLPETC